MSSVPTSVSYASTIIGFVSFGFTFLTLLRVTWANLETLVEAPSEIKYTFANLKSALHEERCYLRFTQRLKRRRRSHSGARGHRRGERNSQGSAKASKQWLDSDEGAAQWRVIHDTVRRLCREFAEIERPFLTDAARVGDGKNVDDEKGLAWAEDEREYMADSYINDYTDMTLNHRILWLWKKSSVSNIRDELARVQIRRVSQESTMTFL